MRTRLHQNSEETRLIRQSLRGDAQAQQSLYLRYVQAMYNTVIRMTSNQMDAEDVLQEGFIRVFQNLSQFKGESTLGAWIKRIIINTTLNFIRKNSRRINYLDVEIPDRASLETDVDPTMDMRQIHEAIKTLPEGCRLVFNLHLLEGYQHKEIAQILEISESTSKSQYQRARRLLQQRLSSREIRRSSAEKARR